MRNSFTDYLRELWLDSQTIQYIMIDTHLIMYLRNKVWFRIKWKELIQDKQKVLDIISYYKKNYPQYIHSKWRWQTDTEFEQQWILDNQW